MQQLTERGITVIVNLAPILPFMNDDMENIQGLLSYCVKAGVYGILTDKMCPVLREGNRERFISSSIRISRISTIGMRRFTQTRRH